MYSINFNKILLFNFNQTRNLPRFLIHIYELSIFIHKISELENVDCKFFITKKNPRSLSKYEQNIYHSRKYPNTSADEKSQFMKLMEETGFYGISYIFDTQAQLYTTSNERDCTSR